MPLSGWTDYPREQDLKPSGFGKSPMRRVLAIRYDGDKYLLFDNGEVFKRGYFYRTRRKVPYTQDTIERRLPTGWLYD